MSAAEELEKARRAYAAGQAQRQSAETSTRTAREDAARGAQQGGTR
ncbi:hypothetical protein ACKI16_29630 [Streptomyces scabiei]